MNDLAPQGLGTQLRHLLELLDGGVEDIYRSAGLEYRPRYTPIMRALESSANQTIKSLAHSAGISHSAASQTISKMIRIELVELSTGEDGRERIVALSTKGHALLPKLHEIWRATQTAADVLDAQLSAPLSQVAAEAIEALTSRPFGDRIAREHSAHLEMQT